MTALSADSIIVQALALALACATPLGCGGDGAKPGDSADAKSAAAEAEAKTPEAKAEAAVDGAIAQAGATQIFDPDDKLFSKRACEFLTPEMVSAQFGVPAADIKQTKMMGCLYSWRKDGEIIEAQLMMIRTHKTLEAAKMWFEGATASKTKAQLDGELEAVKGEVEKREELDTDLKKDTAVNIAELAKLGNPDEGVTYDDVPGLADAARISSANATIWIRLGNVTFQVSAFKGPDQPKIEFDPKNTKAIAAEAMRVQKQWIADTLEQRKADAMKLAPVVVEAIAGG